MHEDGWEDGWEMKWLWLGDVLVLALQYIYLWGWFISL
jgi:hypothetical protein